ncbi:MAG: heavy metal translocating P-type ATPase [Actinomycetales bacterium]|nr:heavy metal translocating P-type ATPase [Actinomycetales bacterium]
MSSTVTMDVRGLGWATSAGVVEATLARQPGVISVRANAANQTATVDFDPAKVTADDLTGWIRACGLHCAGRAVPDHLCDPVREVGPLPSIRVPGGGPAAHDHEHHPAHGTRRASADAVDPHQHGPVAAGTEHGSAGHAHGAMSMAAMVRDMRNRFLLAAALSVPIALWSPVGRQALSFGVPAPFGLRDDVFALLLSIPVLFGASWVFFEGAWRALRARTLDMMVLVAVGVGAGWAYSLAVTLTGGGEVFYEAASVLTTFVLLGHWFEMRARGGANEAVRTLLELAPSHAVVLHDGVPHEVPTAQVVVGDLLLIRPGAKVPVDAVVEDGQSEIDESMVTGESMPVPKSVGDAVTGGSMNTTGTLRARAAKVGADTALARIVAMVQEAQNSKAPGQRLADRAAFWLVLVALLGGTATFLAWLGAGAGVQTAMLFAITVVVITCPDALGLATPMAIMVGTGRAAKRGVLFKNAAALEAAARIDTVVMDKTGTLTKGEPAVSAIEVDGIDEERILAMVGAVERESEHPVARAIGRYAAQRGVSLPDVTEFRNVPGHGAIATVDGHQIVVGNRRLLDREGVVLGRLGEALGRLTAAGHTCVAVAIDGRAVGVITLADAVREGAADAIASLRAAGVHVVMLTGDNRATAERIADSLGIDQVMAEVLPGDKAARVSELQAAGRRVAMVGDGVNDAPALATADVGIAIGAGTDVAVETADVVLMRSDPLDVPVALRIGRGTLRTMRQNLAWAVGYNVVALPVAAGAFAAAFGLVLRPEVAALTMSGSSLIVAVNALLLRRMKLPVAGETASDAPRLPQASSREQPVPVR